MVRLSPVHRRHRNRPIEGRKAPAILDREREQVDIRQLLWTEDPLAVEAPGVDQCDVIAPERVIGSGDFPQQVGPAHDQSTLALGTSAAKRSVQIRAA